MTVLRALLLCTLMAAGVGAPAATAADFTWAGGDGTWSAGASWAGGAAPSGAVGSLIFPAAACSAAGGCPRTHDDVAGLSAATISIRWTHPGKDDSHKPWGLNGPEDPRAASAPLTLTAGLDAGFSAPGSANDFVGSLSLPIVLGADNTWTVDGARLSGKGYLGFGLTGGHSLLFNLINGAAFEADGSSMEVGSVTVTGGGTLAMFQPDYGPGQPPGPSPTLNGANGNPVTVNGATLQTTGAVAVGALTATHATIRQTSGSLATTGVTFDGSSTLILQEPSQLTSTGAIDLGGAGLTFYPSQAACQQPNGTVFTLVSTTGALNGTFAGLADGAVLPSLGPGAAPAVWRSWEGPADQLPPGGHAADRHRHPPAGRRPGAAATATGDRGAAGDTAARLGHPPRPRPGRCPRGREDLDHARSPAAAQAAQREAREVRDPREHAPGGHEAEDRRADHGLENDDHQGRRFEHRPRPALEEGAQDVAQEGQAQAHRSLQRGEPERRQGDQHPEADAQRLSNS